MQNEMDQSTNENVALGRKGRQIVVT